MRVTNDLSMLPQSRRFGSSLCRATGVALPLLLALSACGGSSSTSQVGGSAASSSTGASGTPNINVTGGDAGSANGSGGAGSTTTTGPYMLPAGFTMTEKGGFMTGPAIVDTGSAGSSAAAGSGGDSSSGCGTQILGVVRDFKGINEPMGHPDFEHFSGNGASKGIVKPDLGSDQKPVYSQAPTQPFIDPVNGQQTTTQANYDQWYRNTANVNKPYEVFFYFEPNNNVLTFQSLEFFPIDGVGWGDSCHEADADPKTCPPQAHNFGFTTEIHTRFNYKGGETFSFTGDDDLWVFINNKLAIDLGGLHPQASDSVSLDAAAMELGITVGNAYNLDLFHAERHTTASDFRVDTNLEFTNCGTIVPEVPVK
ncbi:MAG TPA: fibro-slime domain-containing protein [Polyangiaceae bacterium]|jgi:fibro-slime domain-containing protein|nr:fibro-slime domain-containing protein [Polyangiaceae bacterium]